MLARQNDLEGMSKSGNPREIAVARDLGPQHGRGQSDGRSLPHQPRLYLQYESLPCVNELRLLLWKRLEAFQNARGTNQQAPSRPRRQCLFQMS